MSRNFTLTKEENQQEQIDVVINADKKFLTRKLQALENELDDAQDALKTRLKNLVAIDESTVEVLYSNIKTLKSKINLYKSFQKEHIDN